MSIGSKIKSLMLQHNLSQKKLAEKCNITESAMSKYINDERKPRVDILLSLSKEFNVSIEYFMDEKITKFKEIKDLVARNAGNLTAAEKLELMNIISNSGSK